tara:strand:+ start:161 stop:700 length:540 start_codon:yes stop_codon:yes gene_type:complete
MRNDNNRWNVPVADKLIEFPGLTIRQIQPQRLTLISGAFSDVLNAAEVEHAFGWPDIATPAKNGSCAVRLRRDRALILDGGFHEDGWDVARGLAISDMTGAYAVFEITGVDSFAFLRRGAALDEKAPSASVNRMFHGLSAMIYAWQTDNSFRLHVTSPMQEAFWTIAQELAAATKDHTE